jgi:ABC-2 type transport system permease protein
MMSGLGPLLKKEIKEQIRTHRLLIVAGIFLFFGITTPLLLKYLPEIIKLSGEQVPVAIPAPTAIQSLVEYAGTMSQLGILIAVLIAMGSIASELRQGTAVMTLSKPVSRAAYVNAKLIAMSLTFLIGLAAASLFCFAYTVWLIGPTAALPFLQLNLLLGLFLIFCLSVTVLFSSIFRSSLAAGGLAIALLIAQALLATIPRVGDFFPAKLLTWGSNLVNGQGESFVWALAVTLIIILVCAYFAQRILKNKEL